jgi:two-component system, sporulation sensor kinase E
MANITLEEKPATILVVDDREENLMVMQAVLKDIPGCTIVNATSGQAAIDLVQKMEFALILMDIQMPGLDGYETSRLIKMLPNGRDVPIIMVSAIYTEDPHILKGYSVGAVDYLPKPFNPDILKAKLGVYLNLYRKAQSFRQAALAQDDGNLPETLNPNDRRQADRRRH